MTRHTFEMLSRVERLGISARDARALRRISMTLHRWYERECGDERGCIERDETTGKTYWVNADTGRRYRIPDRERGAEKRLKSILAQYPGIMPYLQTDPRGPSLYLLSPQDLTDGLPIGSIYTRGVAVYG